MSELKVFIDKLAAKQLQRVPLNVRRKLAIWVSSVETAGLMETRKIRGYRDEKLLGGKKDRRSIRLSKAWRAEYHIDTDEFGNFILILEIHHHDY
ncbi:MAG: hypothetical protein HRU09_03725 [Oligoflexales bacterium]|nr:hypothetical protein [Oligoflexales bacterium]